MINYLDKLLNKSNGQRKSLVKDDFERFLHNNNCTFQHEDDDSNDTDRYFFDFQGGHFVASIKKKGLKGVDITYPAFETVPVEQIQLVRAMCNKYNSESSVLKYFYNTEIEDNNIRIHLTFFSNEVFDDELSEMLNACFYFQRSFCNEYHNALKNQKSWNSDDAEQFFLDRERERFLLAAQEMAHHADTQVMRSDSHDHVLTVAAFLNEVLGLEKPLCDTLTITRDGQCQTFTERDTIHDMEVTRLLVDGEGRQAHAVADTAMAMITCCTASDNTPRTISIVARNEGEDQSSIYLRLTVCLMAKPTSRTHSLNIDEQEPDCVDLLVAYDKASPKEKIAEFEYMWKEAKIKEKNGENLSDEEQLLLGVTDPDIAYNIYWGERHMRFQRYGEALNHLLNAYNGMRTQAPEFSSKQTATFTELCYDIGFCYTDLKQYDRAYYYLSALQNDGNIRHNMELVNCLVNGKDPRLFQVINELISSIHEQFKDEEELSENIIDFINFLKRRRAYALIDFGDLDEAEKAFKAMLDEPENSSYAINELAYIQQLREADAKDEDEQDSSEEEQKKRH